MARLPKYDLVDAAGRHADGASERGLREIQGLQELLLQDLARMRIGEEISGSRRFRLRGAWLSLQVKQTRHWSLMRIEYCPRRSALQGFRAGFPAASANRQGGWRC